MHSCKFVCSGLADSQILNTAISLFFHLINWILRNVHVAPLMGTCTFSFESRVANTSTPASTHSQKPRTVESGSDGGREVLAHSLEALTDACTMWRR